MNSLTHYCMNKKDEKQLIIKPLYFIFIQFII